MKLITRKTVVFAISFLSFIIIIYNYLHLAKKYFIPMLTTRSIVVDFNHYYQAVQNYFVNNLSIYDYNFIKNVPQFIYPPLSLLIFLPISIFGISFGYIAFNVLNMLCFISSIIIIFKILAIKYNLSLKISEKLAIIIILTAMAPLAQNIKAGQSNAIVLFVSILSLFMLIKQKYFWATFILCLGFWIKFYPIILLPLLFEKHHIKPLILGLFCGLILLPFVMLPFIPLKLYSIYFFEIFPMFSDMLIIGSFNQSISAFLMRLNLPNEYYYSWLYLPIPVNIKIINFIVSAILYSSFIFLWFRKKIPTELAFGALLALSCLITPIGWEYTFLLSTLLITYYLAQYDNLRKNQFVMVIILTFVFLIPKPPDAFVEKFINNYSMAFNVVFFNRFIFALLAFYIIIIKDAFTNKRLKL